MLQGKKLRHRKGDNMFKVTKLELKSHSTVLLNTDLPTCLARWPWIINQSSFSFSSSIKKKDRSTYSEDGWKSIDNLDQPRSSEMGCHPTASLSWSFWEPKVQSSSNSTCPACLHRPQLLSPLHSEAFLLCSLTLGFQMLKEKRPLFLSMHRNFLCFKNYV